MAALQAYTGLVASLLMAAVTAQVKGRLADQLQAALERRWLIEQAKAVIMGREELDAQAAFERLRRAARSSTRRLADVAKDVTAGQPLPPAGVIGPGPGPGRPRTTRPPLSTAAGWNAPTSVDGWRRPVIRYPPTLVALRHEAWGGVVLTAV